MFEDKVLERDDFSLDQAESFQSVPASLRETTPQQSPPAWQAPPATEPDEEQPPAAAKQRRNGLLRRPLVVAIGAMLLAATLGGSYVYLDYAKHFQSTDDAFIAARPTALAPKVSGYLTAVPVTDNEHVATGDVIARIDDRDYRIALEQAQAQVAAAQASIDNIDAQLQVQQAQISANEAQQHQQEAALRSAQATLKLSQRQIEALKAQRNSALANLAQAQAQREQAELNLSYTTVTAAQPGRVVNLSAAVGRFAQPGTNLTMFVPDQIWVTANFKEIQLDHMRPGQPVTLQIDA
jgi:membrane fusion protein, multidrug efflux system